MLPSTRRAPSTGDALLERGDLLAQIAERVRTAPDAGSGRLLVVEGVAGIGKTALLREARARAAITGVTVLSAIGTELETGLAYGVVRQLFAPLVSDADDAERLWAGAAALARPVVDPSARSLDIDPSAVMHGLFWLSASAAERGPLLLVVDDAHWSDVSSLRWIAYLARRIGGLSILVVLARRLAGDADPAGLFGVLSADPTTATCRLSPLSEGASATLVRDAVGRDVPDDVCRACHAATGGNPFYLQELVSAGGEGLRAASAGAVGAMAPERLIRSLIARVARLGLEATRLASSIAVLGDRVLVRHAAALAALDAERSEAIADALAAANILRSRRPLEFAHPILRAAIYAELPNDERTALHRSAARLLHADGADPTSIAAQLLLTEPSSDEWVVARLREAAIAARGTGDPAVAAKYLHRALREPPRAIERRDVLYELGTAECATMDPGAVAHLRAALDLTSDPVRRARIGVELTRVLNRPRQLDEVLEVIALVLTAATEHAPQLAAQLEASRIGMPSIHLSSHPADTASAYRLLDRLDSSVPSARSLRGMLASEAILRGGSLAELRRVLDPALTGDVERIAQDVDLAIFIAYPAMIAEQFEIAKAVLTAALEAAQRRGTAFAAGYMWCYRSALHLRLGKVADAEADARQAAAALEGLDPLTPTAMLLDALLQRGEIAEAVTLLVSTGCDQDLPPTLVSVVLLASRIGLRLAAGQHDAALRDLDEAERRVTAAGAERAIAFQWRVEGALACLAAGRVGRARSLADEHLRLAQAFGAPGALGAALRVAGIVHGERGHALLESAVTTLAPTAMRLEHARALAALGAAQHHAGHDETARVTLAQALDLAEVCGALAVAKQARMDLTATGARPRRTRLHGPAALTASELRIATLASHGATNSQLAQALFVTPKTIERHLTAAYAKLRISGRRELAGALGQPAR